MATDREQASGTATAGQNPGLFSSGRVKFSPVFLRQIMPLLPWILTREQVTGPQTGNDTDAFQETVFLAYCVRSRLLLIHLLSVPPCV